MNNGWIKLHRSFWDWEWADDPKMVSLFLYCLLKTNHKDKRYRGTVVKRGTFLTSRELLAQETGLSVRQIRTSLSKLKSTNELTIKSSRQGSVVEVVNYDKYQTATNEATNERPTSDQRATSNKNDKNEKNEKKLSPPSEEDFIQHLQEAMPKVNPDWTPGSIKRAAALQYQTYVDANWHTGHGKKIKIWKTTALNALSHKMPYKFGTPKPTTKFTPQL